MKFFLRYSMVSFPPLLNQPKTESSFPPFLMLNASHLGVGEDIHVLQWRRFLLRGLNDAQNDVVFTLKLQLTKTTPFHIWPLSLQMGSENGPFQIELLNLHDYPSRRLNIPPIIAVLVPKVVYFRQFNEKMDGIIRNFYEMTALFWTKPTYIIGLSQRLETQIQSRLDPASAVSFLSLSPSRFDLFQISLLNSAVFFYLPSFSLWFSFQSSIVFCFWTALSSNHNFIFRSWFEVFETLTLGCYTFREGFEVSELKP